MRSERSWRSRHSSRRRRAFASSCIVDRSELHKGKPVKALTVGKSEKGGRNNAGRITVRFRGGGHKQTYRIVDFKRRKLDVAGKVERLEYDPNRTSFIALDQISRRRAGLHPRSAASVSPGTR